MQGKRGFGEDDLGSRAHLAAAGRENDAQPGTQESEGGNERLISESELKQGPVKYASKILKIRSEFDRSITACRSWTWAGTRAIL
ncbi:MAG: hypothetical protein ACHRXM_32090 [Isosphaerales bacterium]